MIEPRADGRYDVNDCLEDFDDWDCYQNQHGDHTWQSQEWAVELLRAFASAIREGTP